METIEDLVAEGDDRDPGDEHVEAIAKAKAEAWEKVMQTPEGIRVLATILFDICGLDRDGWGSDARQHAWNEGRRSVAIEILGDQINHPLSDAYLRAMEQHMRDEARVVQARKVTDVSSG